MSYILLKLGSLEYVFVAGSVRNGSQSCQILSITAIMPFKVDFGTNWKRILLVINTSLHPVSHRFQVIAD